jgi:hypothetical protein
MSITVNLPEKFKPAVTSTCRNIVYYGGRGGGKTYSFAIIFILKALQSKIKVLCCREIQNSIKESVYETLLLAMDIIGVKSAFNITYDCITCKVTGSTFIFAGLYRNREKIKSIPGINYVWCNEADKISEESWQLLLPTIREEGSQTWVEFNPNFSDDPVYKRYIENPPEDSLIVSVSYKDNPFISDTLLKEKDNDFALRPREAAHIWDGELRTQGAHVWCPPFDQATHIREFDLKQIPDHKIFMALDPHTSFYSAAIWAARWKQGDRFYTWVFDEWPKFSTVNSYYYEIRKKLHWSGTVKDLATQFYAAETGLTITKRYMDTRFAKGFGSKQSNLINTTEGLVETFAKPENGGMLFDLPQEINIDKANDVIKKDMQYNTLIPKSPLNEPCFYVSSKCKNVIMSLRNHRYEEDNEKEMEVYKDHSDCLTILVGGLSDYRWPVKPKLRPDLANYGTGGWMGA